MIVTLEELIKICYKDSTTRGPLYIDSDGRIFDGIGSFSGDGYTKNIIKDYTFTHKQLEYKPIIKDGRLSGEVI